MSRMLRCLLLTVLIATCLPLDAAASGGAASDPDPTLYELRQGWFSRDKAYHFGISAAGSAGLYTLDRAVGLNRWQSAAIAALAVGTAGVLRETLATSEPQIFTQGHLSRRDLVWNTVGIAVPVSLF